ncbi:A-kinase anchoring protein pkaap [Dermatophagoides farinae]|uniref:A-kinase anchoring protein pkaap n=1 Tax=Dermatophagoides farinae TaxID=6954 RepID=UPI003F5F36E8
MPLPNLIKNFIANSRDKLNQLSSNGSNKSIDSPSSSSSSYKGRYSSSQNGNFITSNNNDLSSSHQTSAKQTLSQISGLHSHRNLKPSYQMLLAESMYDPNVTVRLDSCLTCTFDECFTVEQNADILLCFVQFMESLGSHANTVIKCFLQTNCLMFFIQEKFPGDNENSSFENQEEHENNYQNFITDFHRIFNQLFDKNDASNCDVADAAHSTTTSMKIDPNVHSKMIELFDHHHNNDQIIPNYQKQQLSFEIFESFRQSLAEKIDCDYYEKFLRSNFFLKYEYEVLNGKKFQLSDILFSHTLISSAFMDFMATERMKCFVDFLVQYRNYRKFSGQYSDANALYNRFFNCRAATIESFLQVSEPIIEQLQSSIVNIKDPKTEFQSDCFDRIANILLQYFSKTYFPQFLESNHFLEYVQNCDQKLKCSQNQKQKLIRPSMKILSKQSSSSSSTTSNDIGNHKLNSLNIDQTDLLWNRDLKDQLQFTYIDKYGRMNSTLEPEPPRSSPAVDRIKLAQIFRRLSFGNSTNRIESEDDAWRIAEGIINDVCSVTNRQQQQQQQQQPEHPIEFDDFNP